MSMENRRALKDKEQELIPLTNLNYEAWAPKCLDRLLGVPWTMGMAQERGGAGIRNTAFGGPKSSAATAGTGGGPWSGKRSGRQAGQSQATRKEHGLACGGGRRRRG